MKQSAQNTKHNNSLERIALDNFKAYMNQNTTLSEELYNEVNALDQTIKVMLNQRSSS